MKKIDLFFENPTQEGFESLGIVGDSEAMKDFSQRSPHLAKRFFKFEDWLELARLERSSSLQRLYLQNAVDMVASFSDCRLILKEKSADMFNDQLEKKCIQFAVTLEDVFDTLSQFDFENSEKEILSEKGRRLILKALKIAVTKQDFEWLLDFVPIRDEAIRDRIFEKMMELNLYFIDEEEI